MKNRKRIMIAALVVVVGCVSAVWLAIRPRDPLFQGKPESYWIEHISYGDQEQVAQWRGFGPGGVDVLVRALAGADRPTDRIYRRVYRDLGRILPDGVISYLPAPKMDLTRSIRMNLIDLLSRLSKDARQATPAMARALHDEDVSVRQIAITFFTKGEDETCLLNQMDFGAKRAILPEFIRAMQDPNPGLRNNAAVALRFYPEQEKIVIPILTNALPDPVPKVRQLAAAALKRINPEAAAIAGEH